MHPGKVSISCGLGLFLAEVETAACEDRIGFRDDPDGRKIGSYEVFDIKSRQTSHA